MHEIDFIYTGYIIYPAVCPVCFWLTLSFQLLFICGLILCITSFTGRILIFPQLQSLLPPFPSVYWFFREISRHRIYFFLISVWSKSLSPSKAQYIEHDQKKMEAVFLKILICFMFCKYLFINLKLELMSVNFRYK